MTDYEQLGRSYYEAHAQVFPDSPRDGWDYLTLAAKERYVRLAIEGSGR